MVQENNFSHIDFVRLSDLLNIVDSASMDEETYIAKASFIRETLIKTYMPPKYDVNLKIGSDEDLCTTYRGYIKFLTTDLAYTIGKKELYTSNGQRKKAFEKIAKEMIGRGYVRRLNLTSCDHILTER